MFDVKFGAKVFELFIDKLSTVVCDNSVGQVESTYYKFPHKFFGLCLDDLDHWFGFHPFSEVVDGQE